MGCVTVFPTVLARLWLCRRAPRLPLGQPSHFLSRSALLAWGRPPASEAPSCTKSKEGTVYCGPKSKPARTKHAGHFIHNQLPATSGAISGRFSFTFSAAASPHLARQGGFPAWLPRGAVDV